MSKILYTGTHPYHFRCGEQADVVGVSYVTLHVKPRLCFTVLYADGKMDSVPAQEALEMGCLKTIGGEVIKTLT